MSLTVTHLGSGSKGNSTLVASDESRVVIDAGFSGRQFEKRLGRIDLKPTDIDAIIISHHHGDHSKGAALAQRRWGIPIWANFFTAGKMGLDLVNEVNLFESLDRIAIGNDLSLLPVPVPHEGADNVGFIISNAGHERAAVVTDLGHATEELVRHLEGCSHISIEANHDVKRLLDGPYPQRLKDRIMSKGGHLSNQQTGELLARVVSRKTTSIVLTHLSENNNRPHIAESTVLWHIEEQFDGNLLISRQDGPEFVHHVGQSEPEWY